MPAPKILVFAGSTRSGSLNAQLAGAAVKHLALTDAAVTQISLADYPLPLYDGDIEAKTGVPEPAEQLRLIMLAHHGIFIASPEHNANVTALLKNTIDWISRTRGADSPFKNRTFAIGSASPNALGAYRSLQALRQMLAQPLGATVIPDMIFLPRANADTFDPTGALRDEAAAAQLKTVLNRLIEEAARWVR